jgi:hypothetical protein
MDVRGRTTRWAGIDGGVRIADEQPSRGTTASRPRGGRLAPARAFCFLLEADLQFRRAVFVFALAVGTGQRPFYRTPEK